MEAAPPSRRILIAGMGNVLHGDDGFGVAVAEALLERDLPTGATVIEVGIGGFHLVQELHAGYEGLVVVDAVDRAAEPGTFFLLRPDVPDLHTLPAHERRELLADMHYTVPSRALLLAKALEILPGPDRVWIAGCQPAAHETLGIGLSRPVRDAVTHAVDAIERLVASFLETGPTADGTVPLPSS